MFARRRAFGDAATGGTVAENAALPGPSDLTVPRGGGAISGIGETFAATPVSGSGSASVPIATSPGRTGFGPSLSLSYNSGSGNGPFGFGWSLNVPMISRRTEKGLPRYRDDGTGEDGDVFVLSSAEELVPTFRRDPDRSFVATRPGFTVDGDDFVRAPDGFPIVHEDEVEGFRVRRYRPRIDATFARIERWTRLADPNDVHWRTLTPDNVLSVYGTDEESRVADPAAPGRIASWLLAQSRDDKGNATFYRYKAEDGAGAPLHRVSEAGRGGRADPGRSAQRYLKRVLYANRVPLIDPVTARRPRNVATAAIAAADCAYEVVLDYGEHDGDAPTPREDIEWAWRPDPISSRRYGFEVRTARRCRRVLMFHHFDNAPGVGRDCLVHSTDFAYASEPDPLAADHPVHSMLSAVTKTGYVRRAGGGYEFQSLPPVAFDYSPAQIGETLETPAPRDVENLPEGIDADRFRLVDLYGEGAPGVLLNEGGAWHYKRNLSPFPDPEPAGVQRPAGAIFEAQQTVPRQPNVSFRRDATFLDLAGDGTLDVVDLDGPLRGFYGSDGEGGWTPFRAFETLPARDVRAANLRFVDLTGDGRGDLFITEDDVFVWHASLAEAGFSAARQVVRTLDEEAGPRVLFSDTAAAVLLSDMTGDGLADIVRVRNSEIVYWPNLGYGRFGAKITMDGAPFLDEPDHFDARRVRLGDIDGTGTADLVYLHRSGARLYFNQSGNGWSRPRILGFVPPDDALTNVQIADLLGSGTALYGRARGRALAVGRCATST